MWKWCVYGICDFDKNRIVTCGKSIFEFELAYKQKSGPCSPKTYFSSSPFVSQDFGHKLFLKPLLKLWPSYYPSFLRISNNLLEFFQHIFLQHSMKTVWSLVICYAKKCSFKPMPIYFIQKLTKMLNIPLEILCGKHCKILKVCLTIFSRLWINALGNLSHIINLPRVLYTNNYVY